MKEWQTLKIYEQDQELLLIDADAVIYWLKEPQHTINIPKNPDVAMSDGFGRVEIYEIYRLDYEPVYDKYLLRYLTQENQPAGLIMSSRELRKLLDDTKNHMKGAK